MSRDDLELDLPPDGAGSVLGRTFSAAVVPGGTVTAVPSPRAGSP
ncbi:hypothetical protein ACFUNF_35730 [Streptomyces sp. NPDC057291]